MRLLLTALLAAAALAPAASAAPIPAHLITPLAAETMSPPVPVKGTDGRWHLAYEVHVENWTGSPVRIDAVAVTAGRNGRAVARFRGARAVAGLIARVPFAEPDPATASVAPGQATILWMNLAFRRRTAIPRVLVHRVTLTGEGPGGETDRFAANLARTRVSAQRPVRLGPPLRGSRFVDVNGCCGVAPHTRALQTFDGVQWLSQRFAIDWLQLDAHGNTHRGDPHDPRSYFIYGEPVLAVADARVVSVLDGRPDQRPPTPDRTLTRENAGRFVTGNHVVLALGHGRYALYAHLQPGSIRVREGQRVHRGQVLARVGNSGNSTEPHLHFHVSDGPLPLEADGLPYVFDRFRVAARAANPQALAGDDTSTRTALAPVRGATLRRSELPLMWDVVDFAG